LKALAYNAGLDGSVVVNTVRRAAKGYGLNVDTNEVRTSSRRHHRPDDGDALGAPERGLDRKEQWPLGATANERRREFSVGSWED
jgi:hypothetical protein